MAELMLKDLVIKYGKVTALNRLNLTIKDGELVTLLGPSGCGKTTTLRSVSGFLPVQGGDIFLNGNGSPTSLPKNGASVSCSRTTRSGRT